MDLGNYPNLIAPSLMASIIDEEHPFIEMPYYDHNSQAEEIFIERYKTLCDAYSRAYNIDVNDIKPMQVVQNMTSSMMSAVHKEQGLIDELIELCEKIVREQFNLSNDEVEFDLEIVEFGELKLPDEMNTTKRVKKRFRQSKNQDILKKRTINALSQGASKKSHYIFHLYHDDFETLAPGITDNYNKAFVGNDLSYFMIDDDNFVGSLSDSSTNNAGYCKIEFRDGKPVIVAKSVCSMLLIHEMTKGVITLLSIPGLQSMSQEVIDQTDYVAAELWDLRYEPTFWELFHGAIDIDDYEIKKLIIMDIFNLPSDEFLLFMDNVLNHPDVAQKEVRLIANKIKRKIVEYDLDNDLLD